jgi:hypothetical protein
MTDDKHERVRQRAYEIWKQAGEPHGDHEQHWRQAVQEIEAEDGAAGGGSIFDEATIAGRSPTDLKPG